MALDRLLTLWPSLTALSSRTGGKTLWAERVTRTNLVALGESGAYDVSGLVARESVTMRMRWRSDVTLRSVFTDGDGAVWLIERIGEIGRHRWLDVAVSNFVDTSGRQTLGVWPYLTSPYTAPAGWTLVSGAAPVQNVTIRAWAPANNVSDPAPRFQFRGGGDRAGFWTAAFQVVNEGFSGSIVSLAHGSTAIDANAIQTRGVRCETWDGRRGRLHVWLLASTSGTYEVQAADAFIPLPALRAAGVPKVGALQAVFDGSARPVGLAVGTALRILSREEGG